MSGRGYGGDMVGGAASSAAAAAAASAAASRGAEGEWSTTLAETLVNVWSDSGRRAQVQSERPGLRRGYTVEGRASKRTGVRVRSASCRGR